MPLPTRTRRPLFDGAAEEIGDVPLKAVFVALSGVVAATSGATGDFGGGHVFLEGTVSAASGGSALLNTVPLAGAADASGAIASAPLSRTRNLAPASASAASSIDADLTVTTPQRFPVGFIPIG